MFLYLFHLFRREPPLHTSLRHQRIGLTIECFVIGFITGINGCRQVHADETSAARGVAQCILLVGRGDERGIAFELLHMLPVWPFDLYARQLNHVLQETLLQLRTDTIELVEVDQQEVVHRLQRGALLAHIEVFLKSPAQFLGQDVPAETGLAIPLG